ncbi:DUF4870 domain-containing protein [Listeria aquatica]|uniref:DUF4870 domain-containing protein n=1 Tax=Listeria aquatica TaxID=1494960 RepID=UPI003F70D187
MNSHKVAKSLSYFSILFAPIAVPLFIWVFTDDKEVQHHAKTALATHVLPAISLFLSFTIFSLVQISTDSANTAGFIAFTAVVSFIIVSILLFFFNIIRGVKMLVHDETEGYYITE